MHTAEKVHKRLFKTLGIAEAAALLVGALYVTGYYINSIFLKNYGIPDAELFRLEYVKIGFVFWLLSTGIVFIPLGAFLLTRRVRRASNLPHFRVGWIGTSLNATLMLEPPLLLAFFATRFEWYLPLRTTVAGFSRFNAAFGCALAVSTFAVILLPVLERICLRFLRPAQLRLVFLALIEPLRFGALAFVTYVELRCVLQIPWLPKVFAPCVSFLAVAAISTGGITAAIWWVRKIGKVHGSTWVYPLIAFGVCCLYYLAITSYVFGVYPAIPMNRGGRMPLTEAYFEVSNHDSLFAHKDDHAGFTIRGPAYVLEQTSDTVYFAGDDMDQWFSRFVTVHALPRSSIAYARLARIEDGFPRVPRPAPTTRPAVPATGPTSQQAARPSTQP